ncbi:MAG: hypothetical protein M3071_19950, partial [Actinomycetota bacterium]|nr:hypothetical protein [Actinomycetota bacterium]
MTLVETRSPLRTIVALLAAAAALLAATGIVELKAFHEPSTLKYGLTIGAPLITVLACTMERPLRLITSLAIVAVPFVGATAAFASTRVSVLVPLLIAGAGLAIVYGPRASRLSSLGLAALFAVPLLSIPVFIGSSQRPFIVALFLLLDVAWLVSRTADDPGGMKVVLAAVAVSAAIQGAIAIWQARTGHQLNLYGSAGSQQFSANYIFTYGSALRPTGAFTDPVSLGDVLGISVPVV